MPGESRWGRKGQKERFLRIDPRLNAPHHLRDLGRRSLTLTRVRCALPGDANALDLTGR